MSDNFNEPLEDILRSKFECPVCFKYIVPPIGLCLSGHSYCSSCFEKIITCALCRANKSPYRCVVLEQVHGTISFPCKYVETGCTVTGKGEFMTNHQEHCEFSSVSCPLRFNSCQWKGLRNQVVSHCNNVHVSNTFFVSKQKLKVTNFVELNSDRNYYILFHVFDNLFRCHWDVRKDTGIMRFAVYTLGHPKTDKKFSFKISILLDDLTTEIISLFGPCYYISDENYDFLDDKYLSTNHCMVKEYCGSNADFNYAVTIIDPSKSTKHYFKE